MATALAIYGAHDSSICLLHERNKYRIYEFERLLKKRYVSLHGQENFREYVTTVRDLIKKEYGIFRFGYCYWAQLNPEQIETLKEVFKFEAYKEMTHHAAHAAGAIYQSDFEQSLVVSSDSGGFEMPENTVSTFCVFLADKTKPLHQRIVKLADVPLDACGAYTLMAVPISEITKEDVYSKYLSYAGKIMGLAAYGNIRTEWIEPMKRFYYGQINLDELKILGETIHLPRLNEINTVSGQEAYDLAATSQHVFEEVCINTILPYVEKYRLPVVLTGGGALNVLLNERLRKQLKQKVFVPVNPNDCGLTFGMMCLYEPPDFKVNISYNGFGILDIDQLPDFVREHKATTIDAKGIARMIASGKIIGIMRGNSEVGARALGNRSILCDPSIKNIKDKLNLNVKYREWFRPFAPVVKLDDVDKYFEFNSADGSPYMSYAPNVKKLYWYSLPAIVHEDHTARLQTVTQDNNPFMYELIDYVETITGKGCVLNTSFNIKGKPILTTIADALEVLRTTELDAVVVEDWLFAKQI